MKEKVSVIITILNGEPFINDCMTSIDAQQTNGFDIEIVVFDDASTDLTMDLLSKWQQRFSDKNIEMVIVRNKSGHPKGVGYGRNMAIEHCSGQYLCFQDIDDEMFPNRVQLQFEASQMNPNAIVGSKFIRDPPESTARFTDWGNKLPMDKLAKQIYTANGPTIVMPTWFCHKNVFRKVGSFSEAGKGTPEDLIFFYKHLDLGGEIFRVNDVLVNYKYHPSATTFSILEETIWKLRLERLINEKLRKSPWKDGFTIWNGGKQGRRFYRDLPDDLKVAVTSFCDVAKDKINTFYEHFDKKQRRVLRKIPIVHFSDAQSPIIVCVKLNMTNGEFEENLRSLKLQEDQDYVIFS